MIFGDLSVFRENEWRQQSRDLQALALGDFTPVQTALRALYPNTELPLRAIPFVKRYVAELTGRYARPVVRRFRAADIGGSWQLLQEAYTDGGVDASFDAVERALVVQGSLVLLPMPDARGVMRLHICQPWQVQAEYSDPEGAQRPETWDKLVVQLPSTFAAEQVIYGQATITRDYAWRTIGGRQVGIYRQDGSNPFGRVPAVVVCFGDAYPGRWHGLVNQAVLNLQVAVCAQVSDNELIVRHCAFPQKVIENAEHSQIVESLQVGPDKVITIIGNGGTGPQPTMRVVQGAVPVAELANAIDNQIRLYCSMLGLDPSPFLRSNTATTASARLFAAQDRQELQDRIKPALLRAEIQTARLFAEWQTYTGVSVVPYRTLLVEVAYTDPVIVADPLHDAQALELRIRLGLSSAAEVVAQERGISLSEAQRIVDKNLSYNEPPAPPAPPPAIVVEEPDDNDDPPEVTE
jgi:hypothetical protein